MREKNFSILNKKKVLLAKVSAYDIFTGPLSRIVSPSFMEQLEMSMSCMEDGDIIKIDISGEREFSDILNTCSYFYLKKEIEKAKTV